MRADVYIASTAGDSDRRLLVESKGEIDQLLSSQDNNPFIEQKRRVHYSLVSSLADLADNIGLLGNELSFSAFSVSPSAECEGVDWTFLKEIDFESFAIHRRHVLDNETLPILSGVNELVLGSGVDSQIDLTKFPDLDSVTILDWTPGTGFTGSNSVRSMTIWGVKGKTGAVWEELRALRMLKSLGLTRITYEDLNGLDSFPELVELEISYATKLRNIDAIAGLTKLSQVSFDVCKKIVDFSPLGSCSRLESLTINNCQTIASIAFLEKLKKLKSLIILGTRIGDADKSVLKKLNLEHCDVE